MLRTGFRWFVGTVATMAFISAVASAQNAAAGAQDHADAIRAAGKAYVDALNRGDSKAMLAAWTPDGDYVNAQGQRELASEMIKREFAQGQTANEAGGVVVDEDTSIRFVTDNVAIEDGVTEVQTADGQRVPVGRFTAVWVNRDGRWLLSSLRETAAETSRPLRPIDELQWIVGEWSGESDDMVYTGTAQWDVGGHFILRELQVRRGNTVLMHASQRIGWDPVHKVIRSWAFDSDGGYSEGAWVNDGDVWYVKNRGVLADGKEVTSINTYTLNEDGTITWRVEGAKVQGEAGPELTVTLKHATSN